MSQRNADDDPVLDAARACVLAVGVRRTTLTDVARRAGVSRMTLYRRFPDLEGVLAALMTREFGRLVADAAARAEGGTTRERLVATVVHGSRALAEDPLFERLLDVDPELLLPYVTQRLGGMQKMAVEASTRALAEADGSVRRDAPPEALAAGMELIARGFVLASHGELALDPWAELARAIDGYLRP
jgi:AcrR family transcriptional regulator